MKLKAIALVSLLIPILVSADPRSDELIPGTWTGTLAGYKSQFTFTEDGEYKRVITIFGLDMITIGKWWVEKDAIRFQQLATIESGRKVPAPQQFVSKIRKLTESELRIVHLNPTGTPVESKFTRK